MYESTKYKMSLFVAGRTSIDLIQMQQNTKGEVAWSKTDGLYVVPNEVNSTHEISIGSGRQYLVFKLSS